MFIRVHVRPCVESERQRTAQMSRLYLFIYLCVMNSYTSHAKKYEKIFLKV